MFSFFQTIFHKVTAVIATAAIAIGLISAPTPQTPVIINPTNITDTHQEAQVQAQKDNTNKAPEENVNLENLMKEMSSSAPQPALQPTPAPSSISPPVPSPTTISTPIPAPIPTSYSDDELTQRSQKITELLSLFDQLEKNYKEPLNKAQGLYLELLLKEYSTKRLTVLDQLIPQIKSILRIQNIPYQFVSIYSELLDVLTIKREDNLNFLNNPNYTASQNQPTYNPPSYSSPISNFNNYYIPLPTFSPPSIIQPPVTQQSKTPQEIDYDIKICNSIGGIYSYGLGCSGY